MKTYIKNKPLEKLFCFEYKGITATWSINGGHYINYYLGEPLDKNALERRLDVHIIPEAVLFTKDLKLTEQGERYLKLRIEEWLDVLERNKKLKI